MRTASPLDDLRRVPLFAALPPQLLAEMAAQAQPRHFRTSDLIMRQGDPGDNLYVIMRGWVEVSHQWDIQQGEGDVVFDMLGPGQLIGEVGVVREAPHSATFVALEPVDSYELPKEAFRSALQQSHAFALAFIGVLADRLIAADRRIAEASNDPLTGLPNRAMLVNAYRLAGAALQRAGGTMAVVLLDVDNLKLANDGYGHAAGDQVLRAVAEALQTELRGMDLVVRYGGDEFAMLLPQTDAQGAERAIARIRARLAGRTTLPVPVTFSCGIAEVCCNVGGEVPLFADVLRRADALLYEEKQRRHG